MVLRPVGLRSRPPPPPVRLGGRRWSGRPSHRPPGADQRAAVPPAARRASDHHRRQRGLPGVGGGAVRADLRAPGGRDPDVGDARPRLGAPGRHGPGFGPRSRAGTRVPRAHPDRRRRPRRAGALTLPRDQRRRLGPGDLRGLLRERPRAERGQPDRAAVDPRPGGERLDRGRVRVQDPGVQQRLPDHPQQRPVPRRVDGDRVLDRRRSFPRPHGPARQPDRLRPGAGGARPGGPTSTSSTTAPPISSSAWP